MKRMCVLCVALFVLVVALPALATETRVQTMGDQRLFIQDDYNIWNYTSTVNNYPRHLIVDHNNSGYTGDSRVGMIVPFMKNAVLGAFFSDDAIPLDFAWYWPGQRIDLFWGYRATNFDLGLHVDWWGDKSEQGPTDKQSASVVGLQAGVGFNANGNMLEFDAAYKKASYAYEPIASAFDSSYNDDGASMIALGARYLWAYNNMVTLVPALRFEQFKENNLLGVENKSSSFDVGAGCNTVPLQGTEFLTSIGIEMDKFEAKDAAGTTVDDENFKILPYVKFGADIQLKPWLNFRVGAQKWIQSTFEDKIADTKETHPNFVYNLGVGIMVGDVQFDAELDNDWLNQGPYFLSGEGDNGDMFPKISFKYDYR